MGKKPLLAVLAALAVAALAPAGAAAADPCVTTSPGLPLAVDGARVECAAAAGQDALFAIAADPDGGTTVVDLEGTTFDATLTVFDGAAKVAALDAADPAAAEHLDFTATAGKAYIVRVTPHAAGGAISIGASRQAPANDTPAGAQPVGAALVAGGNTALATATGEPAIDDVGPYAGTIWFRVTAPRRGRLVADTCGSPGAPVLGVFSALQIQQTAGDGALAGCPGGPAGGSAYVGFDAEPGVSYLVAVARRSGQPGGFVLLRFHYDDEAPKTVIAAAPPPLTNQTSATFTLAGDPPGDVGWFDCAVDSVFIMFCPLGPGNTITFDGLGEGPHTLLTRAVDPAGNSLQPIRYDWTIDRTPPETRIKAAPTGATTATSALIDFDSERDATFLCSLDAAPLSACTSPLALDGLAIGSHTILVIAVDPAGNRDDTPATASWVVDEPTELPAAGPPRKPRPVAAGRLVARWQRRGHGTRARVLKVAGVARRTTVTVRCTGRGCPVGRRSITARRKGTLAITALLEGRALRRGAKLEVAISRSGRTTRLVRFTFGAPGAAPARRELCRTSATAAARPCPAPG